MPSSVSPGTIPPTPRTDGVPPRVPRPGRASPRVDYSRARDLPRLLPLWPEELADVSLPGRRALVARLQSLLRHERQRGLTGDWTYDLARHRQLVLAYRAEALALRMAERAAPAVH